VYSPGVQELCLRSLVVSRRASFTVTGDVHYRSESDESSDDCPRCSVGVLDWNQRLAGCRRRVNWTCGTNERLGGVCLMLPTAGENDASTLTGPVLWSGGYRLSLCTAFLLAYSTFALVVAISVVASTVV